MLTLPKPQKINFRRSLDSNLRKIKRKEMLYLSAFPHFSEEHETGLEPEKAVFKEPRIKPHFSWKPA